MKIKNYMEDFVQLMVNQHLPKMDVCRCEICRLDITAILLNKLPPKYVVSNDGEMYTKANMAMLQYEVDVLTELAKAAEIVKQFPRHTHNEAE